MQLPGLEFCSAGVNHLNLITEVQAERKYKLKSYLCPRCKEELVIAPPVGGRGDGEAKENPQLG